MHNSTRGTVYKSRAAVQAADRRQTLRLVSGIGTALFAVASPVLVAWLIHPPLLTWWLS